MSFHSSNDASTFPPTPPSFVSPTPLPAVPVPSSSDGWMPTPPAANSMSSARYSFTRAANTWNDKMAAPLACPLVHRNAALRQSKRATKV